MAKYRFHKGLKANLPSTGLIEGHYYQCTDTGELYLATSATTMILVAIEDAPSDGQEYVRKDGQWVCAVPPEPITMEVTESGTINVPAGYTKCEAFLVNGGNGAGMRSSSTSLGNGGNNTVVEFPVNGGSLNVTVGTGGTGIASTSGYHGGTTSIMYGDNTYNPEPQGNNSISGKDGTLNPLNDEDTSLYGASGSNSITTIYKTGGGYGAKDHYNGSFYGAGGGFYSYSSTKYYGNGYQGYVYLKFSAE